MTFRRAVGWFCLAIIALLLLFLIGSLVVWLWSVTPVGGRVVLVAMISAWALALGVFWGFDLLGEEN